MNWFRAMSSRKVLLASVPPLASIFGSGFLIIVPVLESAFGRRAVFAVALVCVVAFLAGIAVRHNIRYVEDARRAEIGVTPVRLRPASAAATRPAAEFPASLSLQLQRCSPPAVL